MHVCYMREVQIMEPGLHGNLSVCIEFDFQTWLIPVEKMALISTDN